MDSQGEVLGPVPGYQHPSCSSVTQGENSCLREQISAMTKELEITKEKLYTLEQAWENEAAVGTDFFFFLR